MSSIAPSGDNSAAMARHKAALAARRKPDWYLPRTIQGRLLSLMLVLVIPVLVLQAVIYYSRFQDRYALELQSNLDLARSAAADFENYIVGIRLHMEITGMAIARLHTQVDDQLDGLLEAIAAVVPSVDHFLYLDSSGRLLAPKDPQLASLENIYRPYFERIGRGENLVVSDLWQEPGSGKERFVVVVGIREEQGVFQGVMLATVDPSRLGAELAIRRSGKGFYSIVDRQGRNVYRHPEGSSARTGQDLLSTQPQLAEALAGAEFAGTVISPTDGKERIVARAPIRSVGWAVAAGRTKADVMAPLTQDLVRDFGILLLASIVAFLTAAMLGYTVSTPIKQLRVRALAIGRNKLLPPGKATGIEELDQLAIAINWLESEVRTQSEQREKYIADLERAEEPEKRAHDDQGTSAGRQDAALAEADETPAAGAADVTEREEPPIPVPTHDRLTGLPNRRLLEDALGMSIARARQGMASALLFLDLDDFKSVNNRFDQAAGDQLLVSVTTLLRNELRAGDLVARLGGDEFAVLLESIEVNRALDIGTRLSQCVQRSSFAVGGHRFDLSVCLGLVPVDGKRDTEEVMSLADAALHRAKEQGRNQIVLRLPA
ncbi:MAG: GGDEF domain-containing protein [Chloroflexi bacterium]|nr:GGDEF domain-containing protein [Chloroflexota bacterium]